MRRVVAAGLAVVAGVTLWASYQLGRERTLSLSRPGASTTAGGAGDVAGATADSPEGEVVTGPEVETGYGPIQVEVTLVGDQLVRARTLIAPDDTGRSVALSTRALPLLNAAAVEVQSAELDTVTGATYTSDGYRESLQAALDTARQ